MSGAAPRPSNPDRFALGSLIDAMPDAIVLTDENGRIVDVNTQAIGMFGYSRDELIGSYAEILLPPNMRENHVGQRRGYVERPRVRPMGFGDALCARHKDGHELKVEIRLAPYQSPDGFLVVASIREAVPKG